MKDLQVYCAESGIFSKIHNGMQKISNKFRGRIDTNSSDIELFCKAMQKATVVDDVVKGINQYFGTAACLCVENNGVSYRIALQGDAKDLRHTSARIEVYRIHNNAAATLAEWANTENQRIMNDVSHVFNLYLKDERANTGKLNLHDNVVLDEQYVVENGHSFLVNNALTSNKPKSADTTVDDRVQATAENKASKNIADVINQIFTNGQFIDALDCSKNNPFYVACNKD